VAKENKINEWKRAQQKELELMAVKLNFIIA
jgi:hypothetical protein